MADNVNKLYSGITDAQMLEETQTILDLFVGYQSDFAAFDAALDAAFAADVQEKIDAGIDFPSDETVQNEISELTVAVNVAWEACKAHFQDAKYFIEKAFPGNMARHKVFGFGDYTEMSRVQSKVMPFMDQFGDTAVQYGTELIAAGYTLAKIEAIAELASAFNDANRLQEKVKKLRLELTQSRTIAMNAVWSAIKIINMASKSVYRNNYARLQMFLMPAPASNETPEALSLRGTIINTATNLPEAMVAVSLPDLGIATTSDLTGSFAFAAGTPAGATALIAVKTGFGDYASSVVLVDDTTVVKNIQLTPD